MRERKILEYYEIELPNETDKEKKRKNDIIQYILKDNWRNHDF